MNSQQDTIILATRNKGKVAELSGGLEDFGLTVKGLSDFPEVGEVEETGTTFYENSLKKAREVAERTGLVAVADDSGLEVDALDGSPGVYSARYAGENADDDANNEKLLRELSEVPEHERTARFKCVMTACAPNGETLITEGAWEGRIALEPRGEKGFGYDPLFLDPDAGKTAAQMDREAKNARSHRGKALRRLIGGWPEFWRRARSERQ
jgi:XTP/dITP diphosphohydrolase